VAPSWPGWSWPAALRRSASSGRCARSVTSSSPSSSCRSASTPTSVSSPIRTCWAWRVPSRGRILGSWRRPPACWDRRAIGCSWASA
jgi:hypothetical protein